MQKGKLIVIDGGDGSGKGTQCSLLVGAFTQAKLPVLYIDFPRYNSYYGSMVGSMMRGEYGPIESISPYLASLPYALDRKELKEEISQALDQGIHVIANRYTTANMGHQTAKLTTQKEQDAFLQWITHLEYTVQGIPKEDLVLYLHVDPHVAQKLIDQKDKRDYMATKTKDEAEKNLQHQLHTERAFMYVASKFSHWHIVECVENGTILPKDRIQTKLITLIDKKLSLSFN